jgi:fructose-bisphosphate aldolase class I
MIGANVHPPRPDGIRNAADFSTAAIGESKRHWGFDKMTQDLQALAKNLIADGKGILAADETVPTLTRRFDALGIQSTEQSRRTYREMLFTAPGIAEFISGVIMQVETIRQNGAFEMPLTQVLESQGIYPGIKVDTGAKPLANSHVETITEGLDGLRDRLATYRNLGARFAKWRAVIRIADTLPSRMCVSANAHALARYAALCQEQNLVPIVEPEVLMNGSHTLERCEEVTGFVLHCVFAALFEQGVALESILLKPNMVIAGEECLTPASVDQVAAATLRCLRRHVPAAVPGIVFLSGGQDERTATAHLNAINTLAASKPWTISFSYGRALQDPAREAWHGRDENLPIGKQALYLRARCNGAASLGNYASEMEDISRADIGSLDRREWLDD